MDTAIVITKTELNEWRSRIEAAWQRSVESVIEVGRLVKQAKDELGVSFALLETELPFSSTVAAFLIKNRRASCSQQPRLLLQASQQL